jgi:hypothetical protein
MGKIREMARSSVAELARLLGINRDWKPHGYDAFLSHSSADGRAVTRLHAFLEAYSLPRLLRPRRGRLRIYHYRHDQKLNPSLNNALIDAMNESRRLILAASPAAAASPSVGFEVLYFGQKRGPKFIDLALVDGTIASSMPIGLKYDGQPIYADLRCGRYGMVRWMFQGRRKFKKEALRVAAALLDVDLDELVRRDEQRRRRRQVFAMVSVIAVITPLFALFLRTPDRAWNLVTDKEIGRPIQRAAIVPTTGNRSSIRRLAGEANLVFIRSSRAWTERRTYFLDDFPLTTFLVTDYDLQGNVIGAYKYIRDKKERELDNDKYEIVKTIHTLDLTGTLKIDVNTMANSDVEWFDLLNPYLPAETAVINKQKPRSEQKVYGLDQLPDAARRVVVSYYGQDFLKGEGHFRAFRLSNDVLIALARGKRQSKDVSISLRSLDKGRSWEKPIAIPTKRGFSSAVIRTGGTSSEVLYLLLGGQNETPDQSKEPNELYRLDQSSSDWKPIQLPSLADANTAVAIDLSVSADRDETIALLLKPVGLGDAPSIHILLLCEHLCSKWQRLSTRELDGRKLELVGVGSKDVVVALSESQLRVWRPLSFVERLWLMTSK